MASPLFHTHSDILAGWKTGSRKVVGLKMAVSEDKKKTLSQKIAQVLVEADQRAHSWPIRLIFLLFIFVFCSNNPAYFFGSESVLTKY
jgi:hypothetical protein